MNHAKIAVRTGIRLMNMFALLIPMFFKAVSIKDKGYA